MRITAVETVLVEACGNVVWVRVHTDEGLIGTGETFRNPKATIAYLHETAAPYLLGKDPLQIDRHAHALMRTVGNRFDGFPTRSVELRGNSAVDIALWDLFGQAVGQPIHQLLGGLSRERLRIYNTCASATYNRVARADRNTETVGAEGEATDDLWAQVHEPERLAESLLAEGIGAMKIWPTDVFAAKTDGHHISLQDLKTAIEPVRRIRHAVGEEIDVMMEYHGLWQLPAMLQIAAALEDYAVYWHEDAVPMYQWADLQALKAKTRVRLAGSESLGTRAWYREAFTRGVIDVAHFDMGWIGGLTEGKRIASLADTFGRPIAPHDCVGPIQLVAAVHLVMNAPNALVQETVRAFYRGYYRDAVTKLPRIEQGYVYPMEGTGLGTALQPALLERPDCCRQVSRA